MNEEIRIEVNFETNVADWRRVLFWYRWKRLAIEFAILIGLSIPVLYFFGINLFDWENHRISAFSYIFTVLVLILLSLYFGVWRQAENLKKIAEPATAVFSDTGLKTQTASSSSEKNWERFSNIFETQEDFIFFLIENVFFTIPKRFVQKEKQSVLKNLFRTKLGERARLKN